MEMLLVPFFPHEVAPLLLKGIWLGLSFCFLLPKGIWLALSFYFLFPKENIFLFKTYRMKLSKGFLFSSILFWKKIILKKKY
jgi:hypothetical protein